MLPVFMFHVCLVCSLQTCDQHCWERARVSDVSLCFCHSLALSYGVSDQVWIVSIADLCLLNFYAFIRISSQSRWGWAE